MHEMGIAEQLMKIAESAIPETIENPKVEQLNLKIGKLSAVVESSLTFCFEIISKGTIFEDAKVVIEAVPVLVKCKKCGKTFEVDGPDFTCKTCPGSEIDLLTGREIEITSLELAD